MSGDVVPFSSRYLRPPDNLSEAAKRHFTDLVTTVPSGHFAPSDLPLLSRWAELCALCERAELELASTGPVLPDGKISTWFTVLTSTAKSLNGLALRLRLGPQARRLKQSKKVPAGKASYYDVMRLEEGWDDIGS